MNGEGPGNGASGVLLRAENLSKSFSRGFGRGHTVRAVRGVSFELKRNEVFGLVGESGSGKTTLARVLLHLEPLSGGRVLFDGTDPGKLRPAELRTWRHRMQIVFQDPNGALDPRLSAYRSLEEGLSNRGFDGARRKERIGELADLVSIPFSSLARRPHEFSGGQRQRIVIARALSMDPEFLVLDEPVSNLDVSVQAQIVNLLMELKAKLSLTMMFISHDLRLVSHVSDRIAVMYRGRIVENGPAEAVARNPEHAYTKLLYSSIPGPRPRNAETGTVPVTVETAGEDSDRDGEFDMIEIRESHFILQNVKRRRS